MQVEACFRAKEIRDQTSFKVPTSPGVLLPQLCRSNYSDEEFANYFSVPVADIHVFMFNF